MNDSLLIVLMSLPNCILSAFFCEKYVNVKYDEKTGTLPIFGETKVDSKIFIQWKNFVRMCYKILFYLLFCGGSILQQVYGAVSNVSTFSQGGPEILIFDVFLAGVLLILGSCSVPLRLLSFVVYKIANMLPKWAIHLMVPDIQANTTDIWMIMLLRAAAFILSYLIFAGIYFFIWKKYLEKSTANVLSPFIVLITAQWMCMVFILITPFLPNRMRPTLPIFMVMVIMCLLGVVGFQFAVRKLRKNYSLENDVYQMQKHMEMQLMQYENLREQSRQAERLRHEFKNHMQTVQMLIENGHFDDASEMINELGSRKPVGFEYCANGIVNVIMCSAAQKCEASGIRLETELNIPEQLSLSAIDVCSLFANLMDNAVEACQRSCREDKFISFKGAVRGEQIVLHIINSKSENEKPEAKEWRTSKADVQKHGYGTRIIKDILQRCGGSMVTDDRGERMEMTIGWGVGCDNIR